MLRSLGDLGLVVFEADGDAMVPVIDGMYRTTMSGDGTVQVPTRVSIGEEVVDVPRSAAGQPAQHGWILLDLPLIRDNQLLMADLGAINVWAVGEKGFEDDRALDLFAVVKKRLMKSFAGSAVVYSRLSDTGGTPTPGIRLTSGAIEWWSAGGELMQDGVLNNRYRPDLPLLEQ